MTFDGLFLYAETYMTGQGHWEISVATRANTQSSFSAFQPEPILNTATQDAGPAVLPDGSGIYFTRADDLFHASRSGSTWTTPTPVSGMNSSSSELYPMISEDDLTLFFASNRPADWASKTFTSRSELPP
jgi:hypothetical protein